jgi:hypothetical protein
MWVWGHANGSGRSIEEIAGDFIALNEATRALPDSGRVGRYKNLQAIFDRAVRGLAGTFTDHRRYLRGQTPGEGPGQA